MLFISYRRADTLAAAGRLRDRLTGRYGPDNVVFRDYENLEPGREWPQQLRQQLANALEVVALIGAKWDCDRLDDPSDWVRAEVVTAVESNKLFPLHVDHHVEGVAPPSPRWEEGHALNRAVLMQALALRNTGDFDADFERICDRLETRHPVLRDLALQHSTQVRLTRAELTASQQITQEKIRAQLLASAEATHQQQLAEAETASGWQRRQQLKEAAEQEHAVRLLRIQELARSFAEIEGTARSSTVFTEMSRILAEEGVDDALAYIASQQSNILDTIRARQKLAEQKNRDELRPLLKAAELHATRNEVDAAQELYDSILAQEPNWPEALNWYRWFQVEQGDRAMNYRTLAHARQHFQLAEKTTQRLFQLNPTDPQAHRNLSISYDRLGDVSVASGDLVGAKQYFEQGLEIASRLADQDRSSAQMQRDLSISYDRLGDVSVASGDLVGAKQYFEQGLVIRRRLADQDRSSAQMQRDLSISYDRLGDVSVASGDLVGAKQYFEQGLVIRRRLADQDRSSAQMQRDLSISYDRLGDVSVASGDLVGAKKYFEQDLQIARRLADQDRSSAQMQRDLSISYDRLGDVSVASGDLVGAKQYFEQGLVIRRRLADQDRSSAQMQRDLSISFNKLGDVSVASGDLVGAKQYFEQGLVIRRRLADQDPSSAQMQRDAGVSHHKLFGVYQKMDQRADARHHLAEFVRVWGNLESTGRLPNPTDQSILNDLRKQLEQWSD